MDTHVLAYVAGIVDGEGCISLAKRKQYVTPIVQISNTDRALLEWLLSLFGGHINERPDLRGTRKTSWAWVICGAKAREVIRALRPWLRIKNRQADIVLHMGTIARTEIPRDGKTGKLMRLSPDYHAKVATCLASIRALNRRGLPHP